MAIELKDWLNSITFTKEDLSEHISEYPAFIVKRILGSDKSLCALVNELNKQTTMPPIMQYKFLLYAVPKRKRFNPYLRKEKNEDLQLIKEYYNVSTEKAKDYLAILEIEQIQEIKRHLFKGGKG